MFFTIFNIFLSAYFVLNSIFSFKEQVYTVVFRLWTRLINSKVEYYKKLVSNVSYCKKEFDTGETGRTANCIFQKIVKISCIL